MPNFGNPLPGRKKADPADTPTCGQAIVFNCATNLWQASCVTGGESNTSSNSGCGAGLAQAKCGVDLPFKSLTGTDISRTENACDVGLNFAAQGTSGQVLTSNGACSKPTFQASGGGFTTKVKACDQSITCDNTLTLDCCLQFCADANSSYALFGAYNFTTGATGDWKYTWTLPTNGTGKRLSSNWNAGVGEISTLCMTATSSVFVTGGCEFGFVIAGTMNIGACAGVVGLSWAQNVSNACSTTLKKGSWLMFKKL